MKRGLPGFKRPSSHDFLSFTEQAWCARYCIPQKCRHVNHVTWLCIELYLAKQPGSTGLESVTFPAGGTRLKEFAKLVGRPDLEPDEAALAVEGAYRRFICKNAPGILRNSVRVR